MWLNEGRNPNSTTAVVGCVWMHLQKLQYLRRRGTVAAVPWFKIWVFQYKIATFLYASSLGIQVRLKFRQGQFTFHLACPWVTLCKFVLWQCHSFPERPVTKSVTQHWWSLNQPFLMFGIPIRAKSFNTMGVFIAGGSWSLMISSFFFSYVLLAYNYQQLISTADGCTMLRGCGWSWMKSNLSMNGENQLLVTDEPFEFEKQPVWSSRLQGKYRTF